MKWLRLFGVLALAGCTATTSDDAGDDSISTVRKDLSVPKIVDMTVPPGSDLSGDMTHDLTPPPDLVTVEDLVTPDTDGPVITFVSPQASTFVGGILSVDIQISDPSGVDDNTVHIVVGASNGNPGQELLFQRAKGSDHYKGAIDTAKLDQTFCLPIISVSARDASDNHNLSTAAEQVILDTVGPSVSLDPPDMHIVQVSLNKVAPSRAFDPVGPWAANDGDIIRQLQFFRARIEDHGNYAPGQKVEWISLVQPGGVQLFISPQSYGDLVVDTDNDTICDAINANLVPVLPFMPGNMGKATMIGLEKLNIGGGADYVPDPNAPQVDVPGYGLVAVGNPQVLLHPKAVCNNDMIVHIGYSLAYLEPAIWSIPQIIAPPSPACEGFQFDSANSQIPEGPVCVAVLAYDNAGNHSVSAPLSLCYDKGGGLCKGYRDPDQGGFPSQQALDACAPKCRPGVKFNVPIQGDKLVPFFASNRENVQVVIQ